MKILITAFEPFGGEAQNPSKEVLAQLPEQIGRARIIKLLLPTAFVEAPKQAMAAMAAHQPDAVLCLGQAGGRAGITIERVAINVDDAGIPDNVGRQPVDMPIAPEGPAAYFCTLPIKKILAAIQHAGLPAGISDSAGTYVCNHLTYALLHHAATEGLATKIGFIHLPFMAAQAEGRTPPVPFLRLDSIKQGILAAVQVLAEEGQTAAGTPPQAIKS